MNQLWTRLYDRVDFSTYKTMTTGMADSAYQDSKYYDIITSLTRQVLASPTLVLYKFPPFVLKKHASTEMTSEIKKDSV